ncbi:inositol polyphosphate kinase kcs1, partial [Coemansia aciculifera]
MHSFRVHLASTDQLESTLSDSTKTGASVQASSAPLYAARRRRRRRTLQRGDLGADDNVSTRPPASYEDQATAVAPPAPKSLPRPPMQEKFYQHHGGQPPLTMPQPTLSAESYLRGSHATAMHGTSVESALKAAAVVPKSYQLIQNRAHYRLRSKSPHRSYSEPPGVWLDINDSEDDDEFSSMEGGAAGIDDGDDDSFSYYGADSLHLSGDEMASASASPATRHRSVFGTTMHPPDWPEEERTIHSSEVEAPNHGSGGPQLPSASRSTATAPSSHLHAEHISHWRDGNMTPPSLALTPFVNQVGGHTPFLKFSGSAICKPMNERERRFYEAVDYLHRDLYKFVPSCLGVVNVTYRKPQGGGDPVPEVVLEQNLHILPSCLARQLVPTPGGQPKCTAAPGSFGARKMHLSGAWREMQEHILKEALSPRALKARARQQARIRER